jgi:hypothetical protein
LNEWSRDPICRSARSRGAGRAARTAVGGAGIETLFAGCSWTTRALILRDSTVT